MNRPMTAEDALAEGFARQLLAIAEAAGADTQSLALLGLAARAVSRSTSDGHVCVDLGEALEIKEPVLLAEARDRLLATSLVTPSSSSELLPLVIDDKDRLYLARYFDYERRLATSLMNRATPLPEGLEETDKNLLESLFAANRERLGGRTDWQMLASALAMRNRLTIIAGGPGTGKTTTVVSLLAALF